MLDLMVLGALWMGLLKRKHRVEARIKGFNLNWTLFGSNTILFCSKRSCFGFRSQGNNGNNIFFHTRTIVRRKRNKIHGLYLDDGVWHTNCDLLEEADQCYFMDLFCVTTDVDLDYCHIRTPRLSNGGVDALSAIVTMEKMTNLVLSMKSFKAPSHEGFQTYFFKKYWNIVGVKG
ncbi:hypothetical protein Lal_00015266 [Lupinus albus]|nr:hypothetical protein Lal_00015266 [Lupinus albus]